VCAIGTSSDAFKYTIDKLLIGKDIELMCYYLEPNLKEWIKQGNLCDGRKLVTKVMLQVSLLTIPRYLSDTSRDPHHQDVRREIGYADLLLAETSSSTTGATLKRLLFEFKCKGVNFLDLSNQGVCV
jgi:hypothetical protein